MDEHCPTCGSAVKVVGETTLHYEPVDQIDCLIKENERLRFLHDLSRKFADRFRVENEALRRELQACTLDCQRVNATCEKALGLLLEIAQGREIKALPPGLYLRIHSFLESE